MPISHTVWSLDEKKPLQAASLVDEKELELLLRDKIHASGSWQGGTPEEWLHHQMR